MWTEILDSSLSPPSPVGSATALYIIAGPGLMFAKLMQSHTSACVEELHFIVQYVVQFILHLSRSEDGFCLATIRSKICMQTCSA
jgi:hypothetical protein